LNGKACPCPKGSEAAKYDPILLYQTVLRSKCEVDHRGGGNGPKNRGPCGREQLRHEVMMRKAIAVSVTTALIFANHRDVGEIWSGRNRICDSRGS